MGRIDEMERQWAFEGAAARLQRLRAEMAQILQRFPELNRGKLKGAPPRLPASGSRYKGKRKISVAGRKAVSDGMRKYWARRKALAKTGQSKAAQAR